METRALTIPERGAVRSRIRQFLAALPVDVAQDPRGGGKFTLENLAFWEYEGVISEDSQQFAKGVLLLFARTVEANQLAGLVAARSEAIWHYAIRSDRLPAPQYLHLLHQCCDTSEYTGRTRIDPSIIDIAVQVLTLLHKATSALPVRGKGPEPWFRTGGLSEFPVYSS